MKGQAAFEFQQFPRNAIIDELKTVEAQTRTFKLCQFLSNIFVDDLFCKNLNGSNPTITTNLRSVIVVMLTWVIPAFQGMFAEFGGEDQLPGLTKMVISLSEGFLDNVWFIIAGVVLLVSSVSYSYRTKKGKRFWHKLLLTAPIIGPVMRKIAVARFTRTLGTLLGSGVPILDSMTIVSRASGNVIVEEAINKTADRIREGKTMSEPLMQTGVFPGMVVQMIGVGEQTGALDTMLNKIADFYEEEVDVAVAALTSLLEPLMMVVIGGIVGVILIAMYMPIFEIAGKIQAG